MSSRRRKSSGDSIDSRSHSFDSTEKQHITANSNRVTNQIPIKRRQREPTVEIVSPSPIPDKCKYFIGLEKNTHFVGYPAE